MAPRRLKQRRSAQWPYLRHSTQQWQHNDIQHYDLICDTQHKWQHNNANSIKPLCWVSRFFIVMLSALPMPTPLKCVTWRRKPSKISAEADLFRTEVLSTKFVRLSDFFPVRVFEMLDASHRSLWRLGSLGRSWRAEWESERKISVWTWASSRSPHATPVKSNHCHEPTLVNYSYCGS
jgi:hypothetical protein